MTTLRLGFSLGLVSMLTAACFNPSDSTDSDGTGSGETSMSGSAGSTSTTTGQTNGSTASASGTSSTSSTSADTSTTTDSATSSADSSGGSSSTGPATNEPPQVTITVPSMDLVDDPLFYDGYDDAMMLWYTDVMVEGVADDLEDGDISDAIVWTTDQSGIQSPDLGSGAAIQVRLYSDDCFGTLHVITASVTDSDNNEASSEPRQIFIYTVC